MFSQAASATPSSADLRGSFVQARRPAGGIGAYLAGDWLISRLIRDCRTGQTGSFLGWGRFSEGAEGLVYRERGSMLLGAYRGLATRSYLYRIASPQRVDVYFPDGRYFHDLDFSDGHWSAEHHCGRDLYAGRFSWGAHDSWRAEWQVSGPRKDWRLTTVLTRCGDGACSLAGRL